MDRLTEVERVKAEIARLQRYLAQLELPDSDTSINALNLSCRQMTVMRRWDFKTIGEVVQNLDNLMFHGGYGFGAKSKIALVSRLQELGFLSSDYKVPDNVIYDATR